ncbi:MAG: SDR family oxidoreductase [Bacteroidetes bacterium]|nr:MAG: SDR family oxidoreductase [Bacteroidota bacterium]
MDTTLKHSIVLITGASSGIGASTAVRFAAAGADLLLCARRHERAAELAARLSSEHRINAHAFALDVRDRAAVERTLDALPEGWKRISVLVNNAGLSRGLDPVHEGNPDDWDEMIDTNVKGLLYVSRKVIPWMVKNGRGHVVNIGSVAGHWVYPKGNVYNASKYAVNALTQGMKMDLLGTPVRVTSVDPGLVETEFSVVRFHGDTERAAGVYKGMTPLTPDDVADAVLWSVTRPPHVNVSEIILMPTDQASPTLVHRTAT